MCASGKSVLTTFKGKLVQKPLEAEEFNREQLREYLPCPEGRRAEVDKGTDELEYGSGVRKEL